MDSNFKPADLILVYAGDDGVSPAIKRGAGSPYNHVAGFVNPSELIEAYGLKPTAYRYVDFYAGTADVFTCDRLSDEQRAQIVANITQCVGLPYSYGLIVWELIRYTFGVMLVPTFEWQPVICSSLWINKGYRTVGIDPCPGIRYPTAADLAKSGIFRKAGTLL